MLVLMPLWVVLIVAAGAVCLKLNWASDNPFWIASLWVSGGAALGALRRDLFGAAVSVAMLMTLILLAFGLPSLN